MMHVWYFGLRRHSGEIAGKIVCKTSFSRFWVFVPGWHLWIGRARHPGRGTASFVVEVFNVGGWLTHGDLVLDAEVDFLAIVEHRLIPATVRGERRKGLATVWAPASQDTSHVCHAGVGVVSLRGAPISLPTFATAQFKRFFGLWSCYQVYAAVGAW